MMKNKGLKERFKKHMRKTYKNKIYALVLFILGLFALIITGDATFLILITVISIGLLLSKDNQIWDYDDEL